MDVEELRRTLAAQLEIDPRGSSIRGPFYKCGTSLAELVDAAEERLFAAGLSQDEARVRNAHKRTTTPRHRVTWFYWAWQGEKVFSPTRRKDVATVFDDDRLPARAESALIALGKPEMAKIERIVEAKKGDGDGEAKAGEE